MPLRTASCSCGQLQAQVSTEPLRVSICHCLACQRRTGSVFGAQARFAKKGVSIIGTSKEFERIGDEGTKATFRFCPNGGATGYYTLSGIEGVVAIPARFTPMATKFSTSYLEGSVSLENLTQTRPLNWVREKRASYPRANGTGSTCWRKLNSSTLRQGPMVTIAALARLVGDESEAVSDVTVTGCAYGELASFVGRHRPPGGINTYASKGTWQ
jgi:hypothetical protein